MSQPQGGNQSLDAMIPQIYEELKVMASRYFRHERQGHTLQTTALVHEAFLRLSQQSGISWQNRTHFLAMASTMMRRILIDSARARNAERRGSGAERVAVDDIAGLLGSEPMDFLALDEALNRLEALDERQARIVEMRFFAGMSVEETAEALEVSAPTVKRHWNSARAFLLHQLSGSR